MKRHLLFKSLLLLCALVVGTNAWADTAGYTPSVALSSTTGTVTGTASETWSYSITFDNAGYYGYQASYGWQLGAGPKSGKDRGCRAFSISTSDITGTITKIEVEAGSYNGNSKINVTVGGSAFGTQNQATYSGQGTSKSTFTGSASGEIVISATDAVRAFYLKSITVTYTPSGGGGSDPSISLGSTTVNATEAAVSTTTINVTYNNLTNYDAEVIFYESDGTTAATYDHSWLTAEINASTKNLDYSITANTGAARIAYLKVYALGDEGDAESSLITVTQAAKTYPVVTTLDFTDAGWGFPSDYDESEKSYTNDGYTITLGESSNGHKVVTTTSNTTTTIHSLIFGKKDATLTLPAFGYNVTKLKVYGYSSAGEKVTFNVFVGDDAVSTEVTSSKVDHEFVIAANKQAVGTIYTIKVTNANNCQISKIEVFGNGCEAGLVQSYGWATYIPTVDVEYPANTAYVVTDASVNDGLTLAAVTQVPAGTPLLLKGAGAKTATVIASASDPTTNLLSVCNGTIDDGKYAYVLAKNGTGACFKQWTGLAATLNGRVVLLLDKAAAARGIFELDDDATGIKQVETSKQNAEGFYNLAGQRIANPTKGLYIVNGKKVIIK